MLPEHCCTLATLSLYCSLSWKYKWWVLFQSLLLRQSEICFSKKLLLVKRDDDPWWSVKTPIRLVKSSASAVLREEAKVYGQRSLLWK